MRLAIGTCVVALILATTLSGDAAERFATVGYLAAIFAAAALAVGRFLPSAAPQDSAVAVPAFPVFLSNSFVVLILVSVAAILVSQPRGEAFLLGTCVLLVVVAVLVRCGGLAAFNAALMRGGVVVAASRYAVLLAICALALGALLGGYAAETFITFAFRVAVAATLLIAASLLAPTRAGALVQKAYIRTVAMLDRLAHAFVFERTASYAAIVAVAAIFPATFLPAAYAEPFAIVGYAAAVAAALGVAMECRRLRS